MFSIVKRFYKHKLLKCCKDAKTKTFHATITRVSYGRNKYFIFQYKYCLTNVEDVFVSSKYWLKSIIHLLLVA